MRVGIVGTSGFIGTNLKMYLEYRGMDVIEFRGRVTALEDVDSFFEYKMDAVINLSAHGNDSSHNQTSVDGLGSTFDTNVIGTSYLYTRFIDSNIKTFIQAGSSSEYGTYDLPLSVDTPLKGTTPYAVTKGAMSQLLSTMPTFPGKYVKVLRLFSVYGPHEKENRLIPTAFNAAEQGKIMNVSEGVHDFIYVEDVCWAFYTLLKNPEGTPSISHAASCQQYTNAQVVEMISQVTGKDIAIKKVENIRPADTTICWMSSAESLLVQPAFDLRRGLEATWQWRQNQS